MSVSALAWFIRTSAAVLLVVEGVIRPVFSVSALAWFIRTSAAVLLVVMPVLKHRILGE
jgi:hypothetical protein